MIGPQKCGAVLVILEENKKKYITISLIGRIIAILLLFIAAFETILHPI